MCMLISQGYYSYALIAPYKQSTDQHSSEVGAKHPRHRREFAKQLLKMMISLRLG